VRVRAPVHPLAEEVLSEERRRPRAEDHLAAARGGLRGRLEREGYLVVQFPQSPGRMTVASERLHAAIVERRLRHPGHPELDRQVAAGVARQTQRGWRLDKADRNARIDALVALAMAVERAQVEEQPARLLGWL
jgi:phage terminase large subunit-like protein